MTQKIESGLQMLSRVIHRPDLEGLNAVVFPQGPYASQIIEITGEEGTGKTLLVTDFLARCLLPKSYEGVQLVGKDSGAVIINANDHFDVFKLAELLQYYVRASCKTPTSNSVQEIVKESLKNLTVINCYTKEQLQSSLLNLESLILQKANISLLVVDTVAAFYWIERIHSNVSYNMYYTSIINQLKSLAAKLGITVFYTKPNVGKESTKKCADITLHLKKIDGKLFEMEIINYSEQYNSNIKYSIEKTFNFINVK